MLLGDGVSKSLIEVCTINDTIELLLIFVYIEQFNKYKPENIIYYATVKEFLQTIPWSRMKFCDESHFKSAGMIVSVYMPVYEL